jgi:hypothetical protein
MGVDKGPVPLFKESRIASASAESATHLPNQEAHSPSNGGFQRPQPLKRGAKSSVLIRRNWIGRRNSPAIPTSSVNVIASIVKTGPRRCFSRFPHASTVGFSKRPSQLKTDSHPFLHVFNRIKFLCPSTEPSTTSIPAVDHQCLLLLCSQLRWRNWPAVFSNYEPCPAIKIRCSSTWAT